MQIIPVIDVPAQNLSAQLANQNCQIKVYQKSTGLFIDLLINDSLVIGGVICRNLNRIVRDAYLGFKGDILFMDMQGNLDPYYSGGLGSRFLLCFVEESDLWGAQ